MSDTVYHPLAWWIFHRMDKETVVDPDMLDVWMREFNRNTKSCIQILADSYDEFYRHPSTEESEFWTVFNTEGAPIGQTMFVEDAAAVLMSREGFTIRREGRILWTEGKEDQPSGESYDFVAETVLERWHE